MIIQVYFGKYKALRKVRFHKGGHYILVGPYWIRYVGVVNYDVRSYSV